MNDLNTNSDILSALKNGVLRLTLNRPDKLNALTFSMYQRLADEVCHAQQNDSVRAIMIEGAGENFTAGNDIADFASVGASQSIESIEDVPVIKFLFALLENTKPLVAAVQGHAIGIGLTLTLHCDYVVVAEGSQFKTPFLDLGLVPEAGSSILLPQLVGRRKATEILLAGEPVSAIEAVELGIANKIVSINQLGKTAEDYAIRLAQKPSEAMRESLELMSVDKPRLRAQMLREAQIFFNRLRSPEAKEIFAKFLSK